MSTDAAFPPPMLGVAGLVFDELGRVLLVQRKNSPGKGEWHIPGGKLEPGETLEACCIREVYEETHLQILPKTLIAVADRQLSCFHYVVIDFLCALAPGSDPRKLSPGTDALEARWIHPSEFNALPLVEGLRPVIEAGQKAQRMESKGLEGHPHLRWLYL